MINSTPKPTWSKDQSGWYLTAPDHYRLGYDLHEFVYDINAWTAKEAKVDAYKRLEAEGGLQQCQDKDCEWCNSDFT